MLVRVLTNGVDDNVVAASFVYASDIQFKHLLLSMSFTDSSSSSVAVRQALYALTALDLQGSDVAMLYKQKALQALFHSYSLQNICRAKERLQQMATGLLLTLFEVRGGTQTLKIYVTLTDMF